MMEAIVNTTERRELDLSPGPNDGAYCTLPRLLPEPWRSATTFAQRVDELIWEGMECLYDIHRTNALHIYGVLGLGQDGWTGIGTEENRLRETINKSGGAPHRGSTFQTVRWTWEHVVMAPASLTNAGADYLNAESPNPCSSCIAKGKPEECKNHVYKRGEREWFGYNVMGRLDELQTAWIEKYAATVRQVFNRESAEEHEKKEQMSRLIDRLRNFEIGTAEGRELTAKLSSETKGREVIHRLQQCRSELMKRLEVAFAEYISSTNEAAPVQREKLKWNGSLQMLARVFDQHAEKGYFARPQTHGENSTEKLARMLLEVFDVDNGKGKPASAGALRKALAGDVSEQVKRYTVRDLSDFEEPRRSLPPEVPRR